MADINESGFWTNLLKKIVAILAKNAGLTTTKKTRNQHVVPYEDGWAVRGEGNKNVTSKHKHQDTAIRKAKTLARKYKADVIIHRTDGTIRDRINMD